VTAARAIDDRPALTVAEVARVLSVHARTVRREIARGRLAAFRVGDSVRVSWQAVEAYRSETRVVPTGIDGGASGGRTHRAAVAGLSKRLTSAKPSNDLPKPSPSLRERLGLGAPKRRASSR
jgi:excisionase family DNA binding protein